jgi:hypothetical protein
MNNNNDNNNNGGVEVAAADASIVLSKKSHKNADQQTMKLLKKFALSMGKFFF